MAIKGYFFNAVKTDDTYDRVYNAEDVTSYLDKVLSSGVFSNPSTQLQVTAGTGMQVVVAEGQGWINGHKLVNTADLPLIISPADVLLARIDAVIFFVDLTDREMGIEVKTGTASSSPVIPDLVRNANRWELMLATVYVGKQTEAITQAMIQDTRPNTAVCGFVSGLVSQVDTSTLFLQYQSAYSQMASQMEAWQEAQQTAFENWLATLTEQLQVGAYIKKFEKAVTDPADNTIVLDMNGYIYEPSDVILAFINGLSANEGSDFNIDDSGENVKVVFNIGSGDLPNNLAVRVLKAVLGTPITRGSVWTQFNINNNFAMNVSFTQEEE